MTDLLTAAQMRAAERAAIDGGAVTGLALMERAGRCVVEAMLNWRPAAGPGRVLVLCGPGNNGGDGFVVARMLHARGWEVLALLHGCDPGELDRLPPDARANARRWQGLGPIARAGDPLPPDPPDLVVDALFGTGLTRPLEGGLWRWMEGCGLTAPEAARHRVAVDVPSGLCSDSGRALGGHVLAAGLTVTFHTAKPGHYLAQGPESCGTLALADIGLTGGGGEEPARLAQPDTAALAKAAGAHKYSHGHLLVLSGGVGRGGAARLAARAALRVGAGLVTLGCPPAALIENAARLDAIMLRPVRGAEGLRALLCDDRINALCLGPGFGTRDPCREAVAEVLSSRRVAVLDADALTAFADDPAAFFARLHSGCVLTPHEGEFGRLFPDILQRLREPAPLGPAFSRLDAVREAAARAGCAVLLKGADTVIAEPSGRALVHGAAYGREAPWLATAGSGDVLAGLIAGLLARGLPPLNAAGTAAWLHAQAARRFGPGLIAEDLPEQLPAVLRELGL